MKLIFSMGINHRIELLRPYAYSEAATLHHTYAMAKQCASLPGCFVECGVGAGGQLMAMSLAYTGKQIYGFDSFQGIPLAGVNDAQQPGIGDIEHDATAPVRDRLVSSGITVHSVENVLENFTKCEIGAANVRLIKGWFQDSLPKWKPEPIALLRLDGDLYESTLVCLEYLYPHVVSGGVVICDDHSLPGAAKALYDYLPDVIVTPVPNSGGVVYFIKP